MLKEINPEFPLEELMLKLQYFGHLMGRDKSLEKTLMLEKIEGRRRRGLQSMRWLDVITSSMDMSCSKFSKPGFNSTWTKNFQILELDLEKAEEPEIKLPTSVRSLKKQESSRKKHLLLLYWLCQSFWLCGWQQTVENSSRDGNTRPPDLHSEKSVCRSRSNS